MAAYTCGRPCNSATRKRYVLRELNCLYIERSFKKTIRIRNRKVHRLPLTVERENWQLTRRNKELQSLSILFEHLSEAVVYTFYVLYKRFWHFHWILRLNREFVWPLLYLNKIIWNFFLRETRNVLKFCDYNKTDIEKRTTGQRSAAAKGCDSAFTISRLDPSRKLLSFAT